MLIISQEQIKEIAEMLNCGFRCFCNKVTGEVIFIPDENKYSFIDWDDWANDLKNIRKNHLDYHEIEPLESRDLFNIMIEFTESLEDNNSLKERLIGALNKRKPFRGFKYVIDNSGIYRQQWYSFKENCIQEWVKREIDRINQTYYEC